MPRAVRTPAAVSTTHGTTARVPGEGPRAFNALGSDIRIEILSALAAHDRTVTELARELRAHPATLRYHLGLLLSQGHNMLCPLLGLAYDLVAFLQELFGALNILRYRDPELINQSQELVLIDQRFGREGDTRTLVE